MISNGGSGIVLFSERNEAFSQIFLKALTFWYFCVKAKVQTMALVYSTNPDIEFSKDGKLQPDTLPSKQQNLVVQKSIKGRGGKVATLVTGFIGKEADLEALGKMLKNKCGTGGSVKDGEIMIQGDQRNKIAEILQKEGYKVKVSGG